MKTIKEMRAALETLEARAAAKLAEVKDDTGAEAAYAIEAEYKTILTEVEDLRAQITEKEREEADAELVPAAQPTVQPLDITSVLAADRARAHELDELCKRFKMSDQFRSKHFLAGTAIKEIKALINDELAQRDVDRPFNSEVRVEADARDRWRTGVEKSLLFRVGMKDGEKNEFLGLTLRELARDYLRVSGQQWQIADPLIMAGMALSGTRAAGMHSTSDFVNVLANVASKSMLRGYEEAPETFETWTSRGTLVDFKATKRVDLNLFPTLLEVPEGAEYKFGTIGDRGETVQLATYGRMFAITRQAIINDDMNVFTRIPQRMGRAARRTIANLVWAILTGNPTMADGFALFSTQHANLAGTPAAITVTSVDAAAMSMAVQKDPDNLAVALNIAPRFFLVPVALAGVARVLMASEFDPNKTQRTPNSVNGLATVIADARLDANSTTAWYMVADPNVVDTIEVSYLNGQSEPTLEQRDGWNVDGVEFKVRLDAAVKALDFRGMFKNAGA